MYRLHIKDNGECGGFYKEGIHSDIPVSNIEITCELWKYLLDLQDFKFKGKLENRVYSINDSALFEKNSQVIENMIQGQTLESRIEVLEIENANLTFLLMESGVI